MACLKCPIYITQTAAKLVEARDGLLRLAQEVPLTDEEKAVADGDVQALNRYIQRRINVPTPQVPDRRYAFCSSAVIAASTLQPDQSAGVGVERKPNT